MLFDWNEDNRVAHLKKHGIDFAEAGNFGWEIAVVVEDTRRNYGEPRFRAFGFLKGRPCVIAFTLREGTMRIVSIRWAHMKEVAKYARKQTTQNR